VKKTPLAIALTLLSLSSAFAQDPETRLALKRRYIAPEEPLVQQRLAAWEDLKFGMFIHWGAYSVAGVVESWSIAPEPYPFAMKARQERGMSYNEWRDFYNNLYRSFNPARFDPEKWAEAAEYAGMKYMVFTTKHHDGFCMFDTKATDYKITNPDCPYSRAAEPDIAKAIFNAFRNRGIKPGAYFSIADWHHQDFWWDFFPPYSIKINYPVKDYPEKWERFGNFVVQQLDELAGGEYGPLEMLWFDQCISTDDFSAIVPWDRMAEVARTNQPGIMMVARATGNKYENFKTPEQTVPDAPLPYPWESCITMTDSWSHKPGATYKSTRDILGILVKVVSRGGSLLLNVGPAADGTLDPEAYERLKEIGDWMKVNSEAIYGTRAWSTCQDGKVCFTCKGEDVYAFYLADEGEEIPSEISFTGVVPNGKVKMLGNGKSLKWRQDSDGKVTVSIPQSIRRSAPCNHIWCIKVR